MSIADELLETSGKSVIEILIDKKGEEFSERLRDFMEKSPSFSLENLERQTTFQQAKFLKAAGIATREEVENAAILKTAGETYDLIVRPERHEESLRNLGRPHLSAQNWTRDYPVRDSSLFSLLMAKGMAAYYVEVNFNDNIRQVQKKMREITPVLTDYFERAEKNLLSGVQEVPLPNGVVRLVENLMDIKAFPSKTESQINLIQNFQDAYALSVGQEKNDSVDEKTHGNNRVNSQTPSSDKQEKRQEEVRSETSYDYQTPFSAQRDDDNTITFTDNMEDGYREIRRKRGMEDSYADGMGGAPEMEEPAAVRMPETKEEEADYQNKSLVWDRIASVQESNPLYGETRIGEKLPRRMGMEYIPETKEMPSGVRVSFPSHSVLDYGNVYIVRKEEEQSPEEREKAFLAMATAARLSGKTFVKLTGSDEFRFNMYLACRKAGLRTDFEPTEEQERAGNEAFANSYEYRAYWGWENRAREYDRTENDTREYENTDENARDYSDEDREDTVNEDIGQPADSFDDDVNDDSENTDAPIPEEQVFNRDETENTDSVNPEMGMVPVSEVYPDEVYDRFGNLVYGERPRRQVIDNLYEDFAARRSGRQASLSESEKPLLLPEKTYSSEKQELLRKCSENLRRKFKRPDLTDEAFLEALDLYDRQKTPQDPSTTTWFTFVKDGEICKRKLDPNRMKFYIGNVLGSKKVAKAKLNRLKDYLKKTPSDKRLLDEAVDLYKRTAEEKLKKLVDVGQRKKQRLVYTNLETLNKEEGVFDVGCFDDCLNEVKKKMMEEKQGRLKDYLKKTPSDKRLLDEAVDLYKRTFSAGDLAKSANVGEKLIYTNLKTLNKEEGVFDAEHLKYCLNEIKGKILEDPNLFDVSRAAEEEILESPNSNGEDVKKSYYLYEKDGKFVFYGVDMEDERSKHSHELGKALGKDDPIYDMLEENGGDLKDILRAADAKGIKFANEADFEKEIQGARKEMDPLAEISPLAEEESTNSSREEHIVDTEVPEEVEIYELYDSLLGTLPDKEYGDLPSPDVELTPKARAVLLDHLQKEAYAAEHFGEDGRDITVKITKKDLRECNKALLNKAVEEFEKRKAEEIQGKGISESLAEKQVTGENMYRAAKKANANASDESMDLNRAYLAKNGSGQEVVVKGKAKKIRKAVASQEHVPANKAILNNIQNQHD